MTIRYEEASMEISSYRGSYEVRFTEDPFAKLRSIIKQGDVILLDTNVGKLYRNELNTCLSGAKTLTLEPSEELKSYAGAADIFRDLIESGFKRNNRLVAIGGGVIQDVTAFVASSLYRGVEWFFAPTNLLAQCDSCIGSKISINFGPYKNQIGGFYPPKMIISSPRFLATLERREILSGLGEMAHYFLIEGGEAFCEFEEALDTVLSDLCSMQVLIKKSLSIKKKMIEIDEFDAGPRNVFNYGHSFGHALESYTQFAIPHGIAVAFGMDIANAISVMRGHLEESVRARVRTSLGKIWSGTPFPKVEPEAFAALLRKDKKNVGADVRLVMSAGIGNVFIETVEVDANFLSVLADCFASFRSE